jgi:hypothetical protein
MLGLAVPALATQSTTPSPQSNSAASALDPGLLAHLKPLDPPVVPKPAAKKPAKPTTKVVAESAALAQAKKTGKPAPVDQDTTSTSTVDANPNGTFSMRTTVPAARQRERLDLAERDR